MIVLLCLFVLIVVGVWGVCCSSCGGSVVMVGIGVDGGGSVIGLGVVIVVILIVLIGCGSGGFYICRFMVCSIVVWWLF